jgi:hypothetical protein
MLCRVLVWLGEETPLSNVGMQSLSEASHTIFHEEEIAALDDILSRPRDLPYESDYEFHDLLKKCNAVAALQDLRSRHAN